MQEYKMIIVHLINTVNDTINISNLIIVNVL